ncbi:MAG TPA: terminase small subunit [Stellaceae bacterium]|nr:terminase small subunit [Stellaceae bacterium]
MATRSPRRGTPRPASGKPRRSSKREAAAETPPGELEDIPARAARLGITPDRILTEYARIAFADLRHIVEWGADGIEIKRPEELSDEDAAAISEIVPGAGSGHSRVKLYDKKAALDAIARHLGMFPLPTRHREDEAPQDQEEEDPREFLTRELARLAAGAAADEADLVADPRAGAEDQV